MICPRCGKLHEIQRFTLQCDDVAWALDYRPVISGFICDGWCYRVEAFPVRHEKEMKAR